MIICGSKLLFLLLIMVVDFTLSLSGEGEADGGGGGVDGSVCKNVCKREKGDNWWFVDKEEEEVDKRRCEKLVTFLKMRRFITLKQSKKGKEESLSFVLKAEESGMKIVKIGGIRKVIKNDMNLFKKTVLYVRMKSQ